MTLNRVYSLFSYNGGVKKIRYLAKSNRVLFNKLPSFLVSCARKIKFNRYHCHCHSYSQFDLYGIITIHT